MTIVDMLIWKRHLAIKKGDKKEVEKLNKELKKNDFIIVDFEDHYRGLSISNPAIATILPFDKLEERFKNVN